MDSIQKAKNIVEALLIVADKGLSRNELASAMGDLAPADIEKAIEILKEEYSKDDRSFTISELAGKCRIVTKPEYMPWISNLYKPERERLSGPSMETLAIIAYKQPVTRAEIESIRGVNVGGVLNTLLEKDLVKIKGRRDVVGKPFVYGTTEKFLEIFGLNSLDELPMLKDFSEEDLEFGKPQEGDIIQIEDERDGGPAGPSANGQETIRGSSESEADPADEEVVS